MTIEIGPNLAGCAWQLCVFGGVAAVVAGVVLVHLVGEAQRIIHALGDLLRAWRGMERVHGKFPWVAEEKEKGDR